MSKKTQDILKEIAEERARQDQIWGGPEHDDEHNVPGWISLIRIYMDKAHSALYGAGNKTYRRRMIQVAALVVAAIESLDRKTKAE